MTEQLKIVMSNDDGTKTTTLTLADPKDDVTLTKVNTAMSIAYTGSIISINGIEMSKTKKAYIHKVDDVELV